MIDLVEEEIKELLTSYKFPGDKTPIVKGSDLAAVEGKNDEWMRMKAKFPMLYQVALAADGEIDEMKYLLKTDRLMAGIAQKIKFTKDQIEEANNDVLRWGFE